MIFVLGGIFIVSVPQQMCHGASVFKSHTKTARISPVFTIVLQCKALGFYTEIEFILCICVKCADRNLHFIIYLYIIRFTQSVCET